MKGKKLIAIIIAVLLFIGSAIGVWLFRSAPFEDYNAYLETKYGQSMASNMVCFKMQRAHYNRSWDPITGYEKNFVPASAVYRYQGKAFNVISRDGEFYDDFQLEDLSELCQKYFSDVLGTEVCAVSPCSDVTPDAELLRPIYDMLQRDNTLWTKDNFDIFLHRFINDYGGEFSIYIKTDFELSPEKYQVLGKQYEDAVYSHFGMNRKEQRFFCSVAFVNFDVVLDRVKWQEYNSGLFRMDAYTLHKNRYKDLPYEYCMDLTDKPETAKKFYALQGEKMLIY